MKFILKKNILLFFVLFQVTFISLAQEDTVYTKKTFFQRLDSIRNWKLETGRSTLTPFIAPSYSPEMQVMITAGGLFTFKLQPISPLLSRSSMPFSIGYSTNGSLNVSIRANIYGRDDKLRITGEYWLKDMPDNYWGVGYKKGRYVEQGKATTAYHRYWKQFKFKVAYQVIKNFFIGFNFDRNATRAEDLNPQMENDDYIKLYGTSINNTGLGTTWRFDSRDFPENAFKGVFVELSGTTYMQSPKSDHDFHVSEIDYRQYQQIVREGSTLAWQIKGRITTNDVPWTELSMLGTPFDLRGYTWGRYRDYAMAFILTEYRYMFARKTANSNGDFYGPLGFVVWGGTGSVGTKFGHLHNWLPNGGVGLRFELQKRMNIRIDYGVGVKSSGFYISFNEAF